ncbi:hypothetical protein [Bacteroides sp. 224]|uniref:hypothetical protein n=1 Tax=Bacteroides sp. 224 TaxID=2302936 RepID=UPI0013D25602|nr:hypothetical protein [Bacteroides sp. 224]NDV63910.1 hypothetical protein [Bacteroides sp. 224]
MDLGTVIATVVGLIGGNITAFMFFPQMRKTKNIENEAKQSEEWKKLYDETKSEIKELNEKIDSLYSKIEEHRDEKVELHKEIKKLVVDNTRLAILKCEVPACLKRTPPTGF